MLTVREAAALIADSVHPVGQEVVALNAALDRVLARDVVSPVSLPPWDNASMDGYAVRASDIRGATEASPTVLPVRGTIAAGGQSTIPLDQGTAIRIMTGAPIPAGADTVVRVEDTDRGIDRVAISNNRDAGRNIRPRGEDLRAGQVTVLAGSVISPARLGVLSSIGAATVPVYRLPRVGIMSSGNELVDIDRFDEVLAGRRIVSSNGYALRASVHRSGAIVEDLGIVADDSDALDAAFTRGLACDLIITSGGVSAGAFDHTRDVVRQLGGSIRVERVRMRPGAPLAFGMIGNTPWLGLPGNPVSALVTFELFGRLAIRKLRGEALMYPVPISVTVDDQITLAAPLTHFFRTTVGLGSDGRLHAKLTGPQGSGLLTSMGHANALMMVPPERGAVSAGDSALAFLLGDGALLAEVSQF